MSSSIIRRAYATLAVATTAVGLCAVAAYPSSAALPDLDRNNGPLALVRADHTELWTAWPDGSGLTRVVSGYPNLSDPTWSPDGRRLAFSSTRSGKAQIYVTNADGTGTVSVSDGRWADRNPAWAPDGSLIAFNRGYDDDDGFYDLWVMTPTGASARSLLDDPTVPDTSDNSEGLGTGDVGPPAWSPDSTRLIYAGLTDDDWGGERCCAVFETDVASGALRQLTEAGAFTEPTFSPDGTTIAVAAGHSAFEPPLRLMNADGSNPRVIDTGYAFTACETHVQWECDQDLAFSPDGKRLIWISQGSSAVMWAIDDGTSQRLEGVQSASWRSSPVRRIAGTDRIRTAVNASRQHFAKSSAGAVVLTRSDNYADALAGTALAVAKNAPLLLTASQGLAENTASEIRRVLPAGRTVYLLGGTSALSADVEAAVRNLGYTPVRLAGTDRFETAVAIARSGLGSPSKIFLASGMSYADALVAGVAAAHTDAAVLLTADNRLPETTKAYLDTLSAPTIHAVGAARGTYQAESIPGTTPDETAVALAKRFFGTAARVGIASSLQFPDALSGGAHAGHNGMPLLLVGTDANATTAYMGTASLRGAVIYGGTAAIGRGTEALVEQAVRG